MNERYTCIQKFPLFWSCRRPSFLTTIVQKEESIIRASVYTVEQEYYQFRADLHYGGEVHMRKRAFLNFDWSKMELLTGGCLN
jgi:hypothetical protein